MKLYKYMTPTTGQSFLKEPLLRITPRKCLNDPFEIKLSASTKAQMVALSNEDITANTEDYMNSHGVISLTETYDSLLMWSHYAKDHKGIVVEFDIDTEAPFSLFHRSKPPKNSGAIFSNVRYRKKRAFLDPITIKNTQLVGQHYFLTKSDEWIYEKEHRYIVPFTMANRIIVDLSYPQSKNTLNDLGIEYKQESKKQLIDITNAIFCKQDDNNLGTIFQNSHKNGFMFFLSVNESCISRLFLGVNSKDSDYGKLIDNVYNGLPYYRRIIDNKIYGVFKAKEHLNRYEVSFIPYDLEPNYAI